MADNILGFYESLADFYHLIFEDWDSAVQRHAGIVSNLLATQNDGSSLRILDCACGIGTQAIGLAMLGHDVTGSDLSVSAVHRAQQEARRRSVAIPFYASNMISLGDVAESGFDAVIAMDNALPHLSGSELGQAAAAIASKLKPNGVFMASIRDYDTLMIERPTIQEPAFYGPPGSHRIVHQVWDWTGDSSYVLHLYITVQSDREWRTHHFVSNYRCLLRSELSAVLSNAGFESERWLMPSKSGFYQPIVLARLSS
jgi:SAM-dependent methyltransferase